MGPHGKQGGRVGFVSFGRRGPRQVCQSSLSSSSLEKWETVRLAQKCGTPGGSGSGSTSSSGWYCGGPRAGERRGVGEARRSRTGDSLNWWDSPGGRRRSHLGRCGRERNGRFFYGI